jgi:hypothetical protein
LRAFTGGKSEKESQEREVFIRKGLKKRTIDRYNENSHLWPTFAGGKGWSRDLCMTAASATQRRVMLVDFVKWLAEEKINGDEISRVISALRSRWVQACADITVFEDESLRLAKKAGRTETARERHLLKEKRRRLPVTMDMIQRERQDHWVQSEEVNKKMVYMGMMLAFNFMWRVSEYVMDSRSSEHAIRAEDILFLRDGAPWRAWEMRTVTDSRKVTNILFVVRSSKTGTGRYLYLSRKSPAESQAVDDVIEWAKLSEVRRGDPFLSRWKMGRGGQRSRLKLTRRMMSEGLKDLARRSGFAGLELAFVPHSLRIGGATAMFHAGKSTQQVDRTGGWSKRSNSREIYQQFNPADVGALSVPETQFKVLGVEEVQQMLPPSFWDEVCRRG